MILQAPFFLEETHDLFSKNRLLKQTIGLSKQGMILFKWFSGYHIKQILWKNQQRLQGIVELFTYWGGGTRRYDTDSYVRTLLISSAVVSLF